MGELIFMAVLGMIGIAFLCDTWTFRVSLMDRSGGAAMFPRVVIVLMLVFIVMRSIAILMEKDRPPFVFWSAFKGERRVYLISLAALVATIKPVGFFPAMSAFILFTVNYFHYRVHGSLGSKSSLLLRCALLVVFVGAVYCFFTDVLHVMLPAGLLG